MIDSNQRDPDGITAASIQGQWLQRQLAESTAQWKIILMRKSMSRFVKSHIKKSIIFCMVVNNFLYYTLVRSHNAVFQHVTMIRIDLTK